MATLPTASLGPLTTIVPIEDFDAWFAKAGIGDKVIYAIGFGLTRKNATCARVRELYEAGELDLNHRLGEKQGAHRRTEYLATKKAPATPAPTPGAGAPAMSREERIHGTPEYALLAELKRAANFERPMPSLAELMRACNFKTRSAVRYRLEKLEDMGLIEILDRPGARRQARIISTGKTTSEAI